MSNTNEIIQGSQEYWDQRVIDNRNDLRGMVWHSGVTLQHQKFARYILSYFKDKKVLDVACGYGRFADVFEPSKYKGFDFSPKMIELAHELHPEYSFEVGDYNDPVTEKYDVVFHVISLGSLGVSEEDFFNKYKDHAEVVISIHGERISACFNPDRMDVCA